tara:strand:- start:5633 stop:6364 length:732 start_codon:yes stop_codon:yes gene_type:complete
MRVPRVYIEEKIYSGEITSLSSDKAHHILHVLRLRVGDQVKLFDNSGLQFNAHIVETEKRAVHVKVEEQEECLDESSLDITLCLAVSKGQHMDFSIQKAVELGVKNITPIISEYSNVKLVGDRETNKLTHWKKIIVGATEQSGRGLLTKIESPVAFDEAIESHDEVTKILLYPGAEKSMSDIEIKERKLILMVGSEGGFSDFEFQKAMDNNFVPVNVGPRILRAETAVVCGVSLAQQLWGDLN